MAKYIEIIGGRQWVKNGLEVGGAWNQVGEMTQWRRSR